MPALSDHHSSEVTKALVIGDSSSGKTGALASLAVDYKLRILDFDNGMDVLKHWLTHPNSDYLKRNPKAIENVHYVTLTDPVKVAANGKLFYTKATAWQRAMNLLNHWKDGDIDLGKVTSWGPDTILVIDSLTMCTTTAHTHHLAMNGKLAATPTQNEARRDVGVTQNYIRDLLSMLYDKEIKCNVLVNSHVTFVTEQGGAPKTDDGAPAGGMPIGYPSSMGRALSPHIPRWFNNMLIMRQEGAGVMVKRKLYTIPQVVGGQMISAKISAPLSVKPSYGIENGLAEFFKDVKK